MSLSDYGYSPHLTDHLVHSGSGPSGPNCKAPKCSFNLVIVLIVQNDKSWCSKECSLVPYQQANTHCDHVLQRERDNGGYIWKSSQLICLLIRWFKWYCIALLTRKTGSKLGVHVTNVVRQQYCQSRKQPQPQSSTFWSVAERVALP